MLNLITDNWLDLLVFAAALPCLYFVLKFKRKCRKCGANWAWREVNKYNEPRSTTVQKKPQGTINGDQNHRPVRTMIEETIEVGVLVVQKECKICGHQATKKSNYRKVLNRSQYNETL